MIKLPQNYTQKIINRYEQAGIEWLESIDAIIEKYTKMFNLKNIKVVEKLTMNIVLFAKSNDYGDIVMKIGSPGRTSIDEIKFIKYCSSKYMTKCYYYNIEDRVMILEKNKPGYTLSKQEKLDERIKIFCDIANELAESNDHLNEFPTYGDTLKEKINNTKIYKNVSPEILDMLNKAYQIYEEISKKNLPKYVLHHDLQHKNILKSESGWKVIDPHGVVGEKVIETCQFIKAELENGEANIDEINMIVEKVSKYLIEDISLIYKALYIETVTKLLFYIKSGYSESVIIHNMDICERVLKFLDED